MVESPINLLYPELDAEKIVLSAGSYYELPLDKLIYLSQGVLWEESEKNLIDQNTFLSGRSKVLALVDASLWSYSRPDQNIVLKFLVSYPSMSKMIHLWIEAGYPKRKIEKFISNFSDKLSGHQISQDPEKQFVEILSLNEESTTEHLSEIIDPTQKFKPNINVITKKKPFLLTSEAVALCLFVGISSLVILLSQRLLFSSKSVTIHPSSFWLWIGFFCALNMICKFLLFTVNAGHVTDLMTSKFKKLISKMIAYSHRDLTLGRVVSLMMIIRQTLNYRDLILPTTAVTLVGAIVVAVFYTPEFVLFLISWVAGIVGLFLILDHFCQIKYNLLSKSRTLIDNSNFKTNQAENLRNWLDARFEFSCIQNVFYSLYNQLTVVSLIVFFVFRWKQSSHLGIEIVLFQTVNLSIALIFKKYPMLRSVYKEMSNVSFFQEDNLASETSVDLFKTWNSESYTFKNLISSDLLLNESFVLYSRKIYNVSFPKAETTDLYFQLLAGIKLSSVFEVDSGETSWKTSRGFSSNVTYFSPELRLVPGTIEDNIGDGDAPSTEFNEVLSLLGIFELFEELGLSLKSVVTEKTFVPYSLVIRILLARAFLNNKSHIWIFSKIDSCLNPELWRLVQLSARANNKIVLISGKDEKYLSCADEYLYFDDKLKLAQGTFLSLGQDIGINFLMRFRNG